MTYTVEVVYTYNWSDIPKLDSFTEWADDDNTIVEKVKNRVLNGDNIIYMITIYKPIVTNREWMSEYEIHLDEYENNRFEAILCENYVTFNKDGIAQKIKYVSKGKAICFYWDEYSEKWKKW